MKLRKKLLLSCAALAACATTMVSTTYAWYVVNPTADASGMTGSTTDAAGDASVYVSKNGTAFTKSVTLSTSDYIVNGTFDPITTANGLDFVDVANTEVTVTDKTSKYIQYVLWIKSDNDATITPKFTVGNTTATDAFTKQTAYQDVASNAAAGSEFFVDAVQALRMSIVEVEAANVEAAATAVATKDSATIYDVQGLSKGAEDAAYVPATGSVTDDTLNDGTTAHTYYTQIMGATAGDAIEKEPSPAASTWANITLTANTAKCFVFTIWLEGADTLCFDSCVGQDFSFALSFTAAATA